MEAHEFKNLRVLHRLKDACGHGLPEEYLQELSQRGLLVDTCLRQVWITATAGARIPPNLSLDSESDWLQGKEAYNFLLQTITGLNSSVPGETNVMGQFRCAFKRWINQSSAKQAAGINVIMHRLFRDSKTVRGLYLENTGGDSYGSLVRKILRPEAGSRILFIGAGKFALSMLPLFKSWDTALWNRRLHKGVIDQVENQNTRVFAPADIARAAQWATHLVMTTPVDNENDRLWIDLAAAQTIEHIVHLSRRRADPGIWNTGPENIAYSDLDDIFDLRRKQTTLRDLRVLRARAACERIAFATETSAATNERLPLAPAVHRA